MYRNDLNYGGSIESLATHYFTVADAARIRRVPAI